MFNVSLIIVFIASIQLLYADPIAKGKDRFLGCAHSSTQEPYFQKYWNQVTPENGTKWGSVEGTRDQMNWSAAEAAYNFAKKYNFLFRFHVLVWGSQQPGWIEALSKEDKLEEIEEWFAATAEKFPDIEYVEVVNEPLHQPPVAGKGGYIDALGNTNDLYDTGWDWVIKAFELARTYFPDSTKLLINEYGLVGSSTNTQKYFEIIHLLQERDLIDGICVQAHAFNTRNVSASVMKTNLNSLAETGLPIQVSEMDIDGEDDDVQLNEYKRVFPVFWHHPGIEGITLWGWRQGLWRDQYGAYLVDDRGAPRPSLEWLIDAVNLLAPPQIISPYLESDVSLTPELSWHQVDSATAYHIQLSSSARFSSNAVNAIVSDTTFQVSTPLKANGRYFWRISTINEYGEGQFSDVSNFTTEEQPTAVEDAWKRSAEFSLMQNYPNPFNPNTVISYELSVISDVQLDVYNAEGQHVRNLVSGRQAAGSYQVQFNASELPSGIYCYRLAGSNFVIKKKMLLLK